MVIGNGERRVGSWVGVKEGKNLWREGMGEGEKKDRNMEVVEGGKGMREGRREKEVRRDGEKSSGKKGGEKKREERGVNIMITDVQHKDHPSFNRFEYYLNICISDSCQRT